MGCSELKVGYGVEGYCELDVVGFVADCDFAWML